MPLPCVLLQALFRSIRARMGQCQLDHFELPCAADMSPLQVSSAVASTSTGGYTTSSGTQPAAASDGGMRACCRAQGSCHGARLCRRQKAPRCGGHVAPNSVQCANRHCDLSKPLFTCVVLQPDGLLGQLHATNLLGSLQVVIEAAVADVGRMIEQQPDADLRVRPTAGTVPCIRLLLS